MGRWGRRLRSIEGSSDGLRVGTRQKDSVDGVVICLEWRLDQGIANFTQLIARLNE